MLTLWGYSKAAQLGGSETPGMWMVGGTMRLFERSADGVIANDLAACNDYTHGLESATEISCPTLLILGTHDIMTPPLRGNEVADCIAVTSERPDAVLNALITIV